MPISITMMATISDKFSKLINKDEYEPRLCNLMNLSTVVFPGRYVRIVEQHSGQCDFIDVESGVKFDAKLPFNRKQGKLIGSNNHDFKRWIEIMQREESQFGEDIVATRGKNIATMELYKIMEDRLSTIQEDEHAIFFFPYPIVMDSKEFEWMHFASDFLDAIFRELNKNKKVSPRNIYVIYPTIDGDIALRCLNNNRREYIHYEGFDEFIVYDFKE